MSEAKEKLVLGGFRPESVSSFFVVESGDRAEIILTKAAELGCSTIVLGRRHLSLRKGIPAWQRIDLGNQIGSRIGGMGHRNLADK